MILQPLIASHITPFLFKLSYRQHYNNSEQFKTYPNNFCRLWSLFFRKQTLNRRLVDNFNPKNASTTSCFLLGSHKSFVSYITKLMGETAGLCSIYSISHGPMADYIKFRNPFTAKLYHHNIGGACTSSGCGAVYLWR